jgi:Flp pilus assembly protein TadG
MPIIKGNWHRRNRQRRGSAVIEFALSMLVLAPIAYGTLHYGHGFFLYNEIVNASRAGARYASMRPLEAAKMDEFKSAVKNMTACGNPGGCTPEQCIVRGVTPERIVVEIAFERNVPARVSVRLESFPGKVMGLPGLPRMTFPYLGQWTP